VHAATKPTITRLTPNTGALNIECPSRSSYFDRFAEVLSASSSTTQAR
jgi:hypothetical protein